MKLIRLLLCVLGLAVLLTPEARVLAQTALSPDDANSIYNDSEWYSTAGVGGSGGTDSSGCSNGTTLVGGDSEQQVWNYFIGKGLSDAQTAGVMGNLMQESHFDPEIMEKGGDSQNPTDADPLGYGLAQWTPGSKIISEAQDNNISGPIYQLGTQLDLVWAQMNGTSPKGNKDMVAGLQKISDPAEAAAYFNANFEGGTDPTDPSTGQPVRESNAQAILSQYGGSGAGTGGGGCTIGANTDCTTVSGDPKILCEAQKYAGIYYRWGGGHQGYSAFVAGCPDPTNPPNNQPTGSPPDPTDGGLSGNPSPCATDCTGLVSIAVDEAFNLNYMWTVAGSMQGAGAEFWKPIPVSEAQAGDIVTTPEHVEIVDHVSGGTVYTFGSHSTGTQTGSTTSSAGDWTSGAWHWTGAGSKSNV